MISLSASGSLAEPARRRTRPSDRDRERSQCRIRRGRIPRRTTLPASEAREAPARYRASAFSIAQIEHSRTRTVELAQSTDQRWRCSGSPSAPPRSNRHAPTPHPRLFAGRPPRRPRLSNISCLPRCRDRPSGCARFKLAFPEILAFRPPAPGPPRELHCSSVSPAPAHAFGRLRCPQGSRDRRTARTPSARA